MSLTWQSNNGTTWVLDGSQGVTTVEEDQGIFTIPTDLVIDQNVGDGGTLVSQRKSPRRVMLCFMLADDGGSVLALWRSFFAALAAGGTLVYAGPSGDVTLTEIVLEGPDRSLTGKDLQFQGVDRYVVSLLALDPWWLASGTATTLNLGSATAFDEAIAFDASIPFDGGTTTTVTNAGDADAYPIIEVTGPATTLQVSSGAGTGWELAAPLTAGQILVVRHTTGGTYYTATAGQLGPYLLGGPGVDWSLLSPNWELFGLPAGANSLGVSATGTTGDTQVRVLLNERYLTP